MKFAPFLAVVPLFCLWVIFQERIVLNDIMVTHSNAMKHSNVTAISRTSSFEKNTSSLSLISPLSLSTNETEQKPVSTSLTSINATANQKGSDKTLALLYPPGMIGGYGNQRMRFTAFVRHAIKRGIPRLLLPSIYFSTTFGNDVFYPIPMEDVFDVDHWNSFQGDLPILVQSLPNDEESDCWMNDQYQRPTARDLKAAVRKFRSALDMQPNSDAPYVPSKMILEIANRSNFLTPLVNVSLAITTGLATLARPGKIGLLPNDLKCTNPKVYGGGEGAGILWQGFNWKIRRDVDAYKPLLKSVSQALRPAQRWQEIAQQCIQNQHQSPNGHMATAPYFALHMRVELDMWHHKCGRNMEKNLSKYIWIYNLIIDMFKAHFLIQFTKFPLQKKPKYFHFLMIRFKIITRINL